ncbi:class I SAM-dependent methyltransferase [Phytoactinopolyspora halotolerans]|uniref:Class I SAM-dependent methyltransferase n=1 Tax=Phytoactinopolyspora halotolerans TaxID=1981512 RepID=A0A6L9SBF1_9ACTN|nr:class I SAM-dependent methyltransferase [Phytoactinopolyspora halotolerans]NEE01871.1 class I SAM-dependent methyltransferase [Phytoactinopolyspora halotolerans]
MDPADFYTGIVAEVYGPLKAHSQDAEPYARFVRQHGEPALELGCGDGEPLLDLRRQGLDVEGLDSSADMLARCTLRARREGLSVVVHQQKMEDLDLPRRYRAIFLAGPTFTLLPDDESALRALRRIHDHLEPDGTAMVPLFIPTPAPPDQFGDARTTTLADGTTLRVSYLSQQRDEAERTQHTMLRYERVSGGDSTIVDRLWTVHWHTPSSFGELAVKSSLDVVDVVGTDGTPADDATEFTFFLRRRL